MTNAVKFIIDYMWDVFNLVNDKLSFELFGQRVQFFSFSLSCVVLIMVISIFWKGVKG